MKRDIKRLICAVLILVMLGVVVTMAGCAPICHSQLVSGRVLYNRQGVSFDEELTVGEVTAVVSVLNGKVTKTVFPMEYACGYDERHAIQIGFTTYYLAQDDCGMVQNGLNGKYFELTNEERDALEAIFGAHAAQYI